MKKWVGLIFLMLNCAVLFAQNSLTANGVTDSVKSRVGKTKMVDGVAMTSSNDVLENITLSKDYTVLVTAIQDAGLTDTFKSKGPITIFAPTNKAFAKMPPGELDTLLKPSHKLDLSNLITYHAIAGKITAKDIERKINASNGQATFKTIAGSTITAKIDSNRNIVLIDENGGESIISRFDIQQSNGMLHVVNAVLIPKTKVI